MDAELEDLKQRVERLEGHLSNLEQRLDLNEIHLQIERPRPAAAGAHDTNERLESMLRSVLLHQAGHTSDLRKAVRYLEILIERPIPAGQGETS